jgi:alpha-L-rhamnosidase
MRQFSLYRNLFLIIIAQLPQVLPLTSYAQFPIIAVSLKCENLINPLGIDEATPRLSWRIQDDRIGAIQTAYQLFVSTESSEVIKVLGNAWQT